MPKRGDGEMPGQNGNQSDPKGQGQGGTGTENNAQQQGQQQTAGQQQQEPKDFEGWLAAKGDDNARALYQQHIAGLQHTVTATRDERDALEQRVTGIKKMLGTDPEKAKSEMDRLTTEIQEANRRIEFLEEATKPEMQCLNPSAAWLVAKAKGLFRSNGSPDWRSIQTEAPQLFGKPVVEINAGAGARGGNGKADMDSWIRKQSGVG